MIQKYVCVPKSDYDVLIVSNGTISQVEAKLVEINCLSFDEIPVNANLTYLDDFQQLISYLDKHNKIFKGKVLFMFFNGLEFIQNLLSDLIDHYNKRIVFSNTTSVNTRNGLDMRKDAFATFEKLENVYFYYDSSIFSSSAATWTEACQIENLIIPNQFNGIVTIANDVLKKISFMIGRIRGLYIDDTKLQGEKVYPLHCLIRNFPEVENINLSSYAPILMNDMLV